MTKSDKSVVRLVRTIGMALLTLVPIHTSADVGKGNEAYLAGDKQTAFHEYRRAAEAGDERAFGRLAGLYLYGAGTEKNFVEAYVWFGLAQEAGDKYAAKFKETAASAMSLPEIEKAEEALRERRRQLRIEAD